MSKEKRLIKDTLIYAIGNFGSKFLAFFMLPIYTSYFSTQEYGQWDLITTTVSMFIPFITFELVSACYRWLLNEKDDNERATIISTSIVAIIKNMIVFNVIIFFINMFIHINNIIYIVILMNVSIVLSFMQQVSRGLGDNKLFVFSGVLNTIITFIINIFLMFVLDLRIEAFFVSTIISNIIVSIVIWIRGGYDKYFRINSTSKLLYKELIKYSFPLIPSSISWWIMNVSDRYLILYFLGENYNGIYAVANKIPSLVVMLSSIFFMAWKDNVIRDFGENDEINYSSKVFSIYSKFMICGVMVLISFSKVMMDILVSTSYSGAWKYTIILLTATLFSVFAQFWGTGYHASKQTKSILNTTIIGAGVNIIFNFIFIKMLGLYAAAISTFLAYFIMWLIRVIDRNKGFVINIKKKELISLFAILLTIFILAYVQNSLINFSIIIASVVIFMYINRDLLKKFIIIFRDKCINT